jgi:hypothetical protein
MLINIVYALILLGLYTIGGIFYMYQKLPE